MFLINAIYFKGSWANKFAKEETHFAPFTLEDNSITQVEMMHAEKANVLLHEDQDVQFIEIPYGNGEFNFDIIVPKSLTMNELAGWLNTTRLNHFVNEADSIVIELEMPKFRMTWKDNLLESLQSMGMHSIGFPNLIEEQLPLEISRVVHQSFIDVSEEGTEAAAATAVGVSFTSVPAGPPKITIDEPFMFLIRNTHTQAVLFMGQLIDPNQL
jgi:serpin B